MRVLYRLSQLSLFLLILLSPSIVFTAPATNHAPQKDVQLATDEPLSVILMIGDGMGYEHVELARLVEAGMSGSLEMQHLSWNSTALTYSADSAITDSAAAGTALATGYKTNNGYVATNPSGQPLETILEYAQTLNKSTGVVTTTTVYHATPACFMTHVSDRGMYTEIMRQIVEESEVDVILGGGTAEYTTDFNTTMYNNGYTVVYDRDQLIDINSGKVLGLFTGSYMNYEQDRNIADEPSILEMTNKSLELLSQDPDGFFLMVEGGRIDHAGHANNQVNDALDTIAFNEAVQVAIDYVGDNNNTILIVTADHETGGLAVVSNNLNSTLPGDLLTEPEKRALRIARANNVSVTWSTDYHTSISVPVYCLGTVFSEFAEDTSIDNTEIYTIMKDYFDGVYLEPEVTDTTAPVIVTSADDLNFIEGDSGQYLIWQASDLEPSVYIIKRNETEVFADSWNNSVDVVYNVTDTPLGTWAFSITFFDESDNSVSDIAYVTVNQVTPTTTTTAITTTTPTTPSTTTTTSDITSETSSTPTTSGTGNPTGLPIDPTLLTIALVGSVGVIVVLAILKKHST